MASERELFITDLLVALDQGSTPALVDAIVALVVLNNPRLAPSSELLKLNLTRLLAAPGAFGGLFNRLGRLFGLSS